MSSPLFLRKSRLFPLIGKAPYSLISVSSQLENIYPFIKDEFKKDGRRPILRANVYKGSSLPEDLAVCETNPANSFMLEEALCKGKHLLIGEPTPFAPSPLTSHVYGYLRDLRIWRKDFDIGSIFVISTANCYVMNAWKHWLITSLAERKTIETTSFILNTQRKSSGGTVTVTEQQKDQWRKIRSQEMNELCRFVSDPEGKSLGKLGLLMDPKLCQDLGEAIFGEKVGRSTVVKSSSTKFVPGVCGEPIETGSEEAEALENDKYISNNLTDYYTDRLVNQKPATWNKLVADYGENACLSHRFAMIIEDGIVKRVKVEAHPSVFTWTTSEFLRESDKSKYRRIYLPFRG